MKCSRFVPHRCEPTSHPAGQTGNRTIGSRATDMGRFNGKYTRKQGLKRTYDYDLSVLKTADGFSWEAKISYAGELKGSPSGIVTAALEQAEHAARAAAEHAIEALAAVQE